jgi:poly(A) polymerase
MSDRTREFATAVVRRLHDAGHVAYFAGGCVRDLLLGRPAKDYDVATTARPEEVREIFGKRHTLAVGQSFGVIIVLPSPRDGIPPVEVATFRTEGDYRDGRRPSRVSFCTPQEDAQRRDFTINGMFYDPLDCRVLDYVGGERDLAEGLVRAIGKPRDRMREDKLRMLRAPRFAAALEFRIEDATAAAIRDMAPELTVVSAERIAQELKKMLLDRHRRRAVELCLELGLLMVVAPELQTVEFAAARDRILRALGLLNEPSFELSMAVLFQTLPSDAAVVELCRRLRLSNEETTRMAWLIAHQHDLRTASSWSAARLKRCFARPESRELLEMLRVQLLAEEGDLHPLLFCEEFLARTPPLELNPRPLLTGADLIAMGLSPGPRFRELLEAVRDGQLNGELRTPEDAREWVRRASAANPS